MQKSEVQLKLTGHVHLLYNLPEDWATDPDCPVIQGRRPEGLRTSNAISGSTRAAYPCWSSTARMAQTLCRKRVLIDFITEGCASLQPPKAFRGGVEQARPIVGILDPAAFRRIQRGTRQRLCETDRLAEDHRKARSGSKQKCRQAAFKGLSALPKRCSACRTRPRDLFA
jgi:hypothetical protein